MQVWVDAKKEGLPLDSGGLFIIECKYGKHYAGSFNKEYPQVFVVDVYDQIEHEFILTDDVRKWRRIS